MDYKYVFRQIWKNSKGIIDWCNAACRLTGITSECTDTEACKACSSVWGKVPYHWFSTVELRKFRNWYGGCIDPESAIEIECAYRNRYSLGSWQELRRSNGSSTIWEKRKQLMVLRNCECDLSEPGLYGAVWSGLCSDLIGRSYL